VLGSVIAIIVACSSSTDVIDPPAGNCRIPSSVPSTAVVVLIKDFAYVPDIATVPRGGQVAWVNCAAPGQESHTATSDAGLWDSPSIAPGAAFVRTFDAAGNSSFDYHCIPHPFMKGSITVQ
jgi:plastocyanin